MIKTTSAQNYGLSFNSQSYAAQIPSDPTLDISGSITLEAWIFPTSWTSEVWRGSIINKEQNNSTGYMLRCGNNGTFNFNIGTGSTWKEVNSPSGTLVLNTWQHVAGVFNGTTLTLYVNGVQVGSPASYTGTMGINTVPLEIGRSNIDQARYFRGRIDEVRIWNTALTATDILAHHNISLTAAHPSYSNLVCYYEMDDFSTDTDLDGNIDLTATVGVPGEVLGASYGPACNALFTSSAPSGTNTVFNYQTTTLPATIGNTNVQILKIVVDVFNDASASQFSFQTNGTTNVSDIVNARLWYTGSNGAFAATTPFGSTITTPPAANNPMLFTGTQALTCGRHYFWLTYDIPPTATSGNFIDATFQSVTIDGTPVVSTTPNPTGNRELISSCAHTLRQTASSGNGWNGGLVDVLVNGTPVLTGVGATFTSGLGPKDTTFYASTSDVISIIRTFDGTSVSTMRVQVLDGNGNSILSAIQPSTTGVTATGYCGGLIFTTTATLITPTSVQLNGNYTNCFPIEVGFRYKKVFQTNYTFVQSTNSIFTYDLQGLSPATNYHYQAYMVNGVDTIYGTLVNFTTSCGAITEVPWYDSFDTYGTGSPNFPTCWTRNSTSTTAPYISTTNASSPGALYFFAGSSGNRIMAITPMFDASIPINSLKAEFKYRASGTDDTLFVGVMTDPLDHTTFESVASIFVSATSVYQDKEVFFNNYTGTGQYIAFRINHGPTSATGYLDNVLIMTIPTCPKPTNLTASNMTTTSADLAWVEFGNATSWEIEYGPVGFTQGTGTIVSASTNPFTLSGLNHSTNYTFYINAVCSPTDHSFWSNGASFWTACGSIDLLPYTNSFDAFGTGTGVLPQCWTRNSVGTTTAPYISSTNFSSPGSLYFSASSTTINRVAAVTPMFDFSIPINTLKAEFKMRASGNDDTLTIGVMSDPTDFSTFEPVDKKVLSTTGTYQDVEVFFNNYTGTGQYIAFSVSYGASSAVVYIDNLVINTIPSCPRPTFPTSGNITTTSADLSWTEYGNATSWEIEYGPVGFTQGTGTFATASTIPFTLNGLNPSTQYAYYVRALCATNDISDWSVSNTFTTLCVPLVTLPYVQDFETTPTGQIPVCFDKLVSGNATVGVSLTSGNYMLNMSSGSTSNNCFLILPPTSDLINTLRVMFKYDGGANHLFKIGYMTDPTLASTFVELHNAPLSNSGSWYSYDLLTTNSILGNERIAIQFIMGSGYSGRLDSLTIMQQPPCVEATNITMTNSGLFDATINWIGTGAVYNLEYKETASTTWIQAYNVTPPYNITGLLQNTSYDVIIQNICDGGILSPWTSPYTFSTLCDLITVLPYVEDFETTPLDAIPSCYNEIQTGGANIKVISSSWGGKVLEMSFGSTSTGDCYIILPKFSAPLNTLRLGFIYNGGTDNHKFGYITDPANPATFTEILSVNVPGNSGWNYFDLLTNNTLTGNERIAIRYNPGATYHNNRYDSLTVMLMPSCLAPNGLTASAITTSEASLAWNLVGSGIPVDFNLEYRENGSTTWTSISGVSNPYILSGLNANTTYQYRIQANCGGGDLSDWSAIASFTTACGAITTLPWSDYFDTYTSGSFPACWSKISSSTTYPQISTGYSASSPGSLYLLNAITTAYHYVLTPQFDNSIAINTLKASFKMRATGLDDTLYVGVMSNPLDSSTFELIAKKIPSTVNTFEDLDVYFNTYTGSGQYIVFLGKYTSSASYIFIDNLVVSTIPACPIPSSFIASNVSATTADFSWVENGSATSWVIEYGPVGFIQGSGTIVNATSMPFTVLGLTPNTTYQFYIQANCGSSYSDYSSPITLTTALIPISLPYVNDFETPSSYSDFGFLNGTQSNKWQIGSAAGVNNTVGGANAMYISNDSGTSWAYTGGTAGNSKVYAYLDIEVPVGVNELLLDFDWIAKGSLYNYEFLRVYLMPLNVPVVAGSNPPTFNSINYDAAGQVGNYVGGIGEHWLSQQTTWQHKQFSINNTQFPTLAGNTWRLYFHWRNDQTTAVQPPATVDNISITISNCPAPNALSTTNITSSSIDLAWTENGTATSWIVEYGPAGFTLGTGTQLTASINPFQVAALTPATTYDFYVKSDCGAGNFSGWTNKVTATTSCVPTTIPFTESFNDASIPNCWSQTYSGALTSNRWSINTGSNAGGTPNQMVCNYQNNIGISRLIAPAIDFAGVVNPVLTFKYMYDDFGAGVTLKIQTSTDLTNWTDQPFILTGGAGDVGPLTASINLTLGAGVNYIAWVVDGNHYQINYWYIDDVTITSSTLPCTTPTNLAISGVAQTQATATWTAGGTETQWEIAYKPSASSTWTTAFVSTIPSYVLQPLTSSTVYDVKVRAICAVGDTSTYSAIVNFTTISTPCSEPTGVNVPSAGITDQTAVVMWTAGGTESQWQVEYKLVSSSNWTTMAISTTTTQLIQALQSNSTYEVRVKAICGAGNESPFTTPVQFTTTGAGTFTITATVLGPGTITPSGTVNVNSGNDQIFTFTPDNGNIVTQLLVDNQVTANVGNSHTFTNVLSNHTIEVHFGVGINENQLSDMVRLYPNPTHSTIEIRMDEVQLQIKECRVYDIYGKLLQVVPINSDITIMDVSHFAAGVYFVRMNSEKGVVTKKFVKK